MAGAGYRLFTAGQVLTAAQVNTYLMEQSNMVFASTAARDTALSAIKSEGNVAFHTDVNTLAVYSGAAWSTIGPVHGALTAWTPAVVQSGSVTCTNNSSTYSRLGRFVFFNFNLAVTGTGTGANVVTVTLPVTALSSGTTVVGVGWLRDSSASLIWTCQLVPNSTTTVKFLNHSTGGIDTTFLGTTSFTAALASGDALVGSGWYEAAGDA